MNKLYSIIVIAMVALFTAQSCSSAQGCAEKQDMVKPGIEVLKSNGFAQLQGKRIGLVTKRSAFIDSLSHLPPQPPEAMTPFLRVINLHEESATEGFEAKLVENGRVQLKLTDSSKKAKSYTVKMNVYLKDQAINKKPVKMQVKVVLKK